MNVHFWLKSLPVAAIYLGLFCGQAPPSSAKTPPEASSTEKAASFPLIFYSVTDNDQAFEQVKRWGATHVHTYGVGTSVEKDQGFFDRAAQHDLKVMADLRGDQRLKKKMSLESLQTYIEHYKNHPALGIWYLYDEPDGFFTAAEIQPLYDLIKKETPRVPIAIALNWTENWVKFGSVQDIVLNDIYPVTGAPFPNASLHTQTNFTRHALKNYKVVMPVLQMMNWKVFAAKGAEELRGYRVDELRHPNQQEMRYMCFASIAMGVKGLSFFSYHRSMETDPQWGDKVFAPVLKEVRDFTSATQSFKMQRIERTEDDEIYTGLWEREEEKWVVMVNAWPAPRKILRPLKDYVKEGSLEPWGATRQAGAALEKGVLKVDAEPWEVFIWRVGSSVAKP